MNKVKIISVVLALFLTSGAVPLGLVYKKNIEERKDLNSKVEQSGQEIKEAKDNESSETEQVLGTSEVKEKVVEVTEIKEVVVDKSPEYIPLVDTNPVVSCSKGRCESKSIRQSECTKAVCCEIKNDVYKWTTDVHECSSLIYENIYENVSVSETKPPIIIGSSDESRTLEAERKTSEAESCQKLKDIYANCTEDFNESMNGYADCQKNNDDATQEYNDETQKYSRCVDNHNDKLEDYNEVEWEYSVKMAQLKQEQIMKGMLSSGIGAKARQELTDYYEQKLSLLKDSLEIECLKPSSPLPEYCNKPTNSCTKPSCF